MIAGVDEVGRGPLAGPVLACAVILNGAKIQGLKDSKQLTEERRNQLSSIIKKKALCWAIGIASVKEIDTINILQASLLAMKRAVEALKITPTKVLVDGNQLLKINLPCEAIIGGDALIREISAASIIAKVTRDYLMTRFHQRHPEYGFDQHKGYATPQHLYALARYGNLPLHRLSFSPVRKVADHNKETAV
ncbi:MAG: ribonuclease HII [Candidatus Berkiellales bacterium]